MAAEERALRLMVCSTLLGEAEAVISSGGFDDVVLSAFSLDCGRPRAPGIQPAWATAAEQERGDTLVLLGGCGSGKIPALAPGVKLVAREQCAYFFANADIIDGEQRTGAYVITPGWLSDWKRRLEVWGFDQELARQFFADSATRLILLDTGVDPRSPGALREFGSYVGLEADIIVVGLDHFRSCIEAEILRWRLDKALVFGGTELNRMRKQFADQALAIDLMAGLAHICTEEETIGQVMNLFEMLFAPGNMTYAAISDGLIVDIRCSSPPKPKPEECARWLDEDSGRMDALDLSGSARIRFSFQGAISGILEIGDLAMPDRWAECAEMTLNVSKICGLALANARMYQEALLLGKIDSLTGLSTRREFFDSGRKEFERSRRYGHPLAAMMLDVDFFKRVNDTFGHAAGDVALKAVAEICMAELRSIDLGCRYGGEEFSFLLPNTGKPAAMIAAERIREKISEWKSADFLEKITVSIGVAEIDGDCPSIESLLERSDIALYSAKDKGRDRVEDWMPAP
jgi:diguanylate cyclase (GGDEF)-like protein